MNADFQLRYSFLFQLVPDVLFKLAFRYKAWTSFRSIFCKLNYFILMFVYVLPQNFCALLPQFIS